MSRKTEEGVVTYKRTFLVEVRCDLCDLKAQNENWGAGAYEVNKTTVRHEQGKAYPEDTDTTTEFVDICPKCFQEKLIPWLRSQGAEIHETDCDS